DPTFRVLGQEPTRSERYQAYRREWARRESETDASDHPVHVDVEMVAVCDLRCGSSEEDPQGFCQIWTHEHIRTQGFDEHTYQRGYMDPVLYGRIVQQCADMGVSSIKLNYRGEPSLHPRIVSFVREAAAPTSTRRRWTAGAWRSSGGGRWAWTGCRSRSATSPPAPSTIGRPRTGGR